MATLWELVSQKLEFRSFESRWGNKSSVSPPGADILDITDPLPDRTVYDPYLLRSLERAVKRALRYIHADGSVTSDLEKLREWDARDYGQGVELSSENEVRDFLGNIWLKKAARILQKFVQTKSIGNAFRFAPADTAQHQQPDIRGRLTRIDGSRVDISIIELKGELIVRKFWKDIINRGREEVRLDWDGRGRWDVVDKILIKVAAYLVSHGMTWLCWTAASHLIVFRLVQRPPQKPYLVISDIVQVDDTREPDPDPVDKRIGERWMTCIVGCTLGGVATHSQGNFDFDVEDLSSIRLDSPNPTPTEEAVNNMSESTSSAGQKSSSSEWLPQSGGETSSGSSCTLQPDVRRHKLLDDTETANSEHSQAFLVFSKGEVLGALAAPLVVSSLLIETEQGNQAGLPCRYWKTEDILSSTIPWLNASGFLGRGSTGMVFSGSWQDKEVAVKIAEGEESRDRLHSESVWYTRIAERKAAKDILPTFFGRFRHAFFDVLVLSKEGSALDSWDDLVPDERLELFSMVLKLHQAGLYHGDLEPRNVLRSISGQLKLVDLSGASEHQCRARLQLGSRKRHRSHFCSELIWLRRALDLDSPKGASHGSRQMQGTGMTMSYHPGHALSV